MRALTLLLLLVPATSAAQVLRGTVLDRADQPLAGVVVTLVDSTETVRARALTGDRGEYTLRAPLPGTFRLRALRIGYRPVTSRPIALGQGELRDERLVLDDVRVALAAVRVVERSACGHRAGNDASAVFSAWDQAMTSIAATSLTSSSRGLSATAMQVERTLEPTGRRIRSQTASVSTAFVSQPWRSLPAVALRHRGYAEVGSDGFTTYHAPGLEVLSATEFLEDHCLRLTAARDTAEIGVVFEPNSSRSRNTEIRGTLWLLRATAELRRLEFSYTNVPDAPTVVEGVAGGTMTFTRLRNGAIVISGWEIRMPRLEKETSRSVRVRVSEILSVGGELLVVNRSADTLYKRSTLAISGTVSDSLSGALVPHATVGLVGTVAQTMTDLQGRFTLSDVLPGEYALAVRTPSLDSIRASSQSTLLVTEGMSDLRLRVPTASQLAISLCGRTLTGVAGRGSGAVLGTVRGLSDSADSAAIANLRIVADWTETSLRAGAAGAGGAGAIARRGRRMETRSDDRGAFRLCGVPTETLLTLRALSDSGRSQLVSLRLSADERFASTALTLDRSATAVATFRGVVEADSSHLPLEDVELILPDLSLRTRSGAEGAFALAEIPAGTHRVIARRVGYGALETELTFAPNEDEERRIVLTRLTVLGEVEVVGRLTDAGMREFEENRRTGLGRFLTRADIERLEGRRMSESLRNLSGAELVGGGSRGYLLSTRRPPSLGDAAACENGGPGSPMYAPTRAERRLGILCACYAQVYVDGTLMNPGQPAEPFDVNSIPPEQIESIEWYASPAQTPARYAGLNSVCGVYVVHRRRSESARRPPS